LIDRFCATTKLEPYVAKAAVGNILLFLRDKFPEGTVAAVIDNDKNAHQAVAAANANSDGCLTEMIEGMTSLMGHGRADLDMLVGKLVNLGLTEAQGKELIEATLGPAAPLIGADGVAEIKAILPAIAQRAPLE
jgi:hypothetical protein